MQLSAGARERVAAVHGGGGLSERLRLYDGWAALYEQDVAALEYRAPHLAAASLASAFPAPPAGARLLDVACGTGLVARELHRRGFRCLHGVDGSAGMLERARSTGLYQQLRRCVLGQEPLPAPAEHYDAVTVVGALGEGQVPSAAVPELLRVTKPGGFLCLTTRSNPSNRRYKAELEAVLEGLEGQGAWQKVLAQEVECWERATSDEESTQGTGYISGVVYIYQKCPVPCLEEG
ncbi:methyltransferase-like protein 27 isoform X1 [Tyto alba]|uniref:methyltransferase-like protein 27 isoform X1 n=1 Tax=Tyto alba TaxID=56313 RepID=UPI001C666F0F|nr:methyltransferase-like protein 27 isoform X1 [Tyto alba]XP_042647793.1 methyltransferase-like protein 27 isoform X1 [Tyto alba]XP_042647794.1 methyltransferase-like protein 27 isoform X1 [Tyto alba]